MKIKAACIGTPQGVAEALSGMAFAASVLHYVIGQNLGVTNVLDRPAEFYVQHADTGPAPKRGVMGVEVRLTGATRDGRTPKQFHEALSGLLTIVKETVEEALPTGQQCQVFCVIMIDGQIETAPKSGKYSNALESEAVFVTGK